MAQIKMQYGKRKDRFEWIQLDTSKLLEANRVSGKQLIGYLYPKEVYGLRCTFYASLSGTRSSGYSTPRIDSVNSNTPPIDETSINSNYAVYSPGTSGSGTVSTTINVDEIKEWIPHYLAFGSFGSSLQTLVSRSITTNEINIVLRYSSSYTVTTTIKISNIYIYIKK